jgi:DNA polymerase elongation subunit (family B)
MGDRVTYYVTARSQGRTNDWQRARPLSLFEPVNAGYDPFYYIEKLDDWLERYGPFLGVKRPAAVEQTELQF